jgi:hypothetical protein
MDQLEVSDPVNLVFSGYGSAARVAYLLQRLDPRWRRPRPMTSGAMYAWIDSRAHGESSVWKPRDQELVLGNVLSRVHIRIYECLVHDGVPFASPDNLGIWSIAGVHREDFRPRSLEARQWHVIQDWMGPQRYVRELFERSGVAREVTSEGIDNDG